MNKPYLISESFVKIIFVSTIILMLFVNIFVFYLKQQGDITMVNQAILLGSFLFIYVAFLVITYAYMLRDLMRAIHRYFFINLLKKVVIHSQPEYRDIVNLTKSKNLTHTDLVVCIEKIYSKVLIGKDQKIEKHKKTIQGYIKEFPIERLPEHIRRNIKILKSAKVDNELINTIIADTQKLVDTNKKPLRTQKHLSAASLFVGLVGIYLSVYSIYQP
ncbi:hypothetical protein [uncultured Gammaproteobacteria bacterium]|uniref:hypothetical protein n=1 Tax=Bathymodiolus heckerae thiotrophic gill symbiont TaxID=1052212 RepID=UPI0010B866D3|nr:hypothetical protein [Bathymodiolus heckerae thiotrophic gill symbiont]CAC9964659.1 hypothetical protein [uncultured Gammaproteobacteria bacterium]SHN89532.1 hypothetical protein BHECKSOX_2005 [Bathymodiolus heckerae thiotrophic gill symbiont]